jgi:hypothetical protein
MKLARYGQRAGDWLAKTICTGQPPKLRAPAKYAPAAVVTRELALLLHL